MQLKIEEKIFQKFPTFILGQLLVVNVVNNESPADLNQEIESIEKVIKETFITPESISTHPQVAGWRAAYRLFGCDPTKYRCSSEALIRQVLKGNTIWDINPLVDLYNYISLKYTVPVGGEDLEKIDGDITLDFALGSEEFIRLGGTENEPPEPGEVVYKDNKGVLCRRWNWREGERTKITTTTKKALIVIDGLSPMTEDTVYQATEELADLIRRFCRAQVSTRIIKSSSEINNLM